MADVLYRVAEASDIPNLKKMWKDIFGDTDSYIELYFSYKFKEGNAFVITVDGEIASTLYVEYNDIFLEGKILKGAYFCGIATYEKYRGRGFAKDLIVYALSHIKKTDIVYLIPANLSLFDFYKKVGFKQFTTLDKIEILRDEGVLSESFSREYDYNTLNGFYENMGNSFYVKRDKRFFDAIYKCYNNVAVFSDGYAVWYKENGVLHLVEYSFSHIRAEQVLKVLLNEESCEKGILYKRWGDTPFSVCITELDVDSIDKKYLNLMLN